MNDRQLYCNHEEYSGALIKWSVEAVYLNPYYHNCWCGIFLHRSNLVALHIVNINYE